MEAHEEQALVELASRDRFRPSRTHPFAIQAVGLRPDLPIRTGAADLQDGGVAAVRRAIAALRARNVVR